MAAAPSVAFPFKGADSTTYTGQTIPTDAGGNVPVSRQPFTATGSVMGFTAGTSAAQALAAAPTRRFLSIDNESASATIAVAFGATPAINAAGSFTIPPGATRSWEVLLPTEAVNIVASAAGTPVTIQSN